MSNDIKTKLSVELSKEIKEESQVVYILSRVRKILEIDNKEKKYKILKFYCDWVLHAEIENTDSIRDLLDGIIAGNPEAQKKFLMFEPFHTHFKTFLNDYQLSTTIYGDVNNKTHLFNRLLSQIYTDTPLVVKTVDKKKITWKGRSGENSYGGSFKVE